MAGEMDCTVIRFKRKLQILPVVGMETREAPKVL